MKKIVLAIFAVSILGCSLQQKIRKYKILYNDKDFQKDSSLVNSFKAVDSIISKNRFGKSFYCPKPFLKEINQKTGISPTGGGSVIGAKFTVNDWISWHKWFVTTFRNK